MPEFFGVPLSLAHQVNGHLLASNPCLHRQNQWQGYLENGLSVYLAFLFSLQTENELLNTSLNDDYLNQNGIQILS